jgi:SAM-dependent methyltransferase
MITASLSSVVGRVWSQIRRRLRGRFQPLEAKRQGELSYWENRAAVEGSLRSGHYEWFFTEHVGIDRAAYRDKRVLDVGCGPRGSLEWADDATERVGVDPLALAYRALGTRHHAMWYAGASSDALPFRDGHFDVVASFNSLDHVDDLESTIRELTRVLSPGGSLLLLAEVNQPATIVEPITLTWDTPSLFDSLRPVKVRSYEMSRGGLFDSIRADIAYDHTNTVRRTGVLSVVFTKS